MNKKGIITRSTVGGGFFVVDCDNDKNF